MSDYYRPTVPSKSWKPKKKTKYNPSREELNQKIEEYLKNGGKIKKLTMADTTYEKYMALRPSFREIII